MNAVAELEERLGDPFDAANPVGFRAVVDADERGQLLSEGEALLTDYGLGTEFVPVALGGRLDRADRFASVMRAVFRRDCTLGLGYGVTSFIAAAPVWTSGDDAQRARIAAHLIGGGRLSAAYTELAHGNDFTSAETRALPHHHGFRLNGRKELVNNAARAEAAVVFARTDDRPGSRSHSHFVVDLTRLPTGTCRRLQGFRTVGVRGCLLGGFEFTDCPLPANSLVGAEGEGLETVLRAFQVTRAVLPTMTLGALDTLLRLTTGFATERTLYSRALATLPHARAVLASAFTDLLICDSLCTVACRALHLLPGQASVLASATKYLVPKLVHEAAYSLSILLGARGYMREGPYAMAQKIIRDLPVLTFGHANAAVCQTTMMPQLPRMARDPGDPAPTELFDVDGTMPPLDFGRLSPISSGSDRITPLLDGDDVLGAELAGWRKAALALTPRDRSVRAGPDGFDVSHQYAVFLAAASCVGLTRAEHFGEPVWLKAALRRLTALLHNVPAEPNPPGEDDELCRELVARCADNVTLDLAARPMGRSVQVTA